MLPEATENESGTEVIENFFSSPEPEAETQTAEQKPEVSTEPVVAQPVVTQPATTTPAVVKPVEAAPSTLALAPDQLTKIIEAARGGASAAVVNEPSEEEINKHFNVVQLDENDVSTIFSGGVEGTKKLKEKLHEAARMGATIAAHHGNSELKKLHEWTAKQFESLNPVRQATEQQQLAKHTEAFHSKFPHFTKEHMPVLKTVYDNLLQRGFKGTPDEVYAKINEEATMLLRTVNPQFGAAPATGQPAVNGVGSRTAKGKVPAQAQSQMIPIPSGGSGSSGARASASDAKSGPAALFE